MSEKEFEQVAEETDLDQEVEMEELCDDDLDNVAGGWTGGNGGGG